MNYVKHILQPGEQVLVVGRLHWIIYSWAIFWFALAAAAAYGAYHFRETNLHWLIGVGATVVFFVFGLVGLIRAWWHAFTTEIAVTNHRVIYKRGFFIQHTEEMNVDKIESVDVDQTVVSRIFDYGTISIKGTGESIERLKLIAHPIELRNAITSR